MNVLHLFVPTNRSRETQRTKRPVDPNICCPVFPAVAWTNLPCNNASTARKNKILLLSMPLTNLKRYKRILTPRLMEKVNLKDSRSPVWKKHCVKRVPRPPAKKTEQVIWWLVQKNGNEMTLDSQKRYIENTPKHVCMCNITFLLNRNHYLNILFPCLKHW